MPTFINQYDVSDLGSYLPTEHVPQICWNSLHLVLRYTFLEFAVPPMCQAQNAFTSIPVYPNKDWRHLPRFMMIEQNLRGQNPNEQNEKSVLHNMAAKRTNLPFNLLKHFLKWFSFQTGPSWAWENLKAGAEGETWGKDTTWGERDSCMPLF